MAIFNWSCPCGRLVIQMATHKYLWCLPSYHVALQQMIFHDCPYPTSHIQRNTRRNMQYVPFSKLFIFCIFQTSPEKYPCQLTWGLLDSIKSGMPMLSVFRWSEVVDGEPRSTGKILLLLQKSIFCLASTVLTPVFWLVLFDRHHLFVGFGVPLLEPLKPVTADPGPATSQRLTNSMPPGVLWSGESSTKLRRTSQFPRLQLWA